MKKKLLDCLLIASKKLEKLHFKLSEKKSEELDYSSLSPIDSGDKEGHYSKALLWAIDNRKKEDIKNIALTGPYGSGKSTILKTFQKNHNGSDLNFLNISLATFKEEKRKLDEDGSPIEVEKDELLRLIETSILQQIFYHEEDKNIPDSRFKKIKSYSHKKLVLFSFCFLLFTISILNYFNPYLIQSIFKDIPFSENTCNYLHYISIIIITIGFIFIIYKSIRIIGSITVDKINFKNVEMGIGESLNKSILNHHLDEILYFFSVTPYNIVIIEDLDRFQETEIFTKLREINLLLNSSKKTKGKDIVFIYAVRDDMFSDNERIKFFDFIIPVIPVINSSNSSEIILAKKKKYKYELSDTFIEDISFFIDDMRLLHNITNEFYLYKQKQGETPLVQDKLFAIITYKNKYPNDFVNLSKNEGDLYNILNSKSDYVKEEISKIQKETSDIKKEIKSIEELNIKNIEELRLIYVLRLIENLSDFSSFIINDQVKTINELIQDENFEYVKADDLYYNKCTAAYYDKIITYTKIKVKILFSETQKIVDSKLSYLEREKQISDYKSNRTGLLKIKIQELEKQKVKTRNLKIAEIIKSNINIDLKINENLNKDFITTLIRNGYISEDYLDYISLFHEGSITRSDHKFIINVKNQQNLEFNYKLSKIDKIISKINLFDFSTEFILNYDLLDFLLKNQYDYKTHLDYIFQKLADESNSSIEFINDFMETTENLSVFVKELANHWSDIFSHYELNPEYSDVQKNDILEYIISYSDISSIKKISEYSNFKKRFISNQNILNKIENIDRLKAIIKELDIKFNYLNLDDLSPKLVDYIYSNNYYQFNVNIVIQLLKKFGFFDQVSFDNSNYSAIQSSQAGKLIANINNNINEYIQNIYLKLDTNINEKEKILIDLLNNKRIKTNNKKLIIEKVNTKISDLFLVKDKDLKSFLIDKNKVEPKWLNLITSFFSDGDISDSTVNFINKTSNALELSKTKIPEAKNEGIDYNVFTKKLIYRNDIDNDSYDLILKSISLRYSELELKTISEEKVKLLIDNLVIEPTNENFDGLKKNFDGLNIQLLEKHKLKFIELIDDLVLDGTDLALILKSTVLNNLEKIKFLETCNNDIIESNAENLKLISQLLLDDNSFEINELFLKNLIRSKSVSIVNRIKIFNKNLFSVDEIFIEKFLKSLNSSYEKITNKNKKAKIQDNFDNRELLNNLKEKSYISSFSKGLFGLRVNHKRK
ncbi:hypothetical protein [Olleya namhaensis]|uniref:YobI family P-loop NTPase n=1 Tax=Olleya namhaensis TaxID=1144750 RepID=UPI00248F82C0|nr:hypothetical protein [Olleya namhaensis]